MTTMLAIRAVGLRYAPLTPRIIQRSGMHRNTPEGFGSPLLLDLSLSQYQNRKPDV